MWDLIGLSGPGPCGVCTIPIGVESVSVDHSHVHCSYYDLGQTIKFIVNIGLKKVFPMLLRYRASSLTATDRAISVLSPVA